MYLIRLDVSKEIGTGHFRRMFHLTNKIKNRNVFFLIETDDTENIIFSGINVTFTRKEKEIEDFRKIIQKEDIQFIILDMLHYKK